MLGSKHVEEGRLGQELSNVCMGGTANKACTILLAKASFSLLFLANMLMRWHLGTTRHTLALPTHKPYRSRRSSCTT